MIIRKIREFLASDADFRYFPELKDDESLIEAGILDSFSLVKLITFLEGEFDLRIEVTDLVEE